MENHSTELQGENKVSSGTQKLKNISSNILIGLLAVIIISMLFLLFQSRRTAGPPSIAGHQMYIVLSGSMSPTFKTGSVIFVKETDPTEIKAEDVITYTGHDGGGITTHRVVEVINEGPLKFKTRGDANNMDDPLPVPAQNVMGVVKLSIPLIGYLFSFARSKEGFLILLIVPGVILIISQAKTLIKHIKEAKAE
ncbi:signal peptidase I [Alkaliphilus serpentinus]|nr:signal peptidase I [Alkaliphilus serpentinus]